MKQNWSKKLENSKAHTVKRLDKNFAGMQAGQRMLLPSPKLVDSYINGIPERESRSVKLMRDELAKAHNADVTCPVATGFVLKTVAEAAYEKLALTGDLSKITPIWRVLSADSDTLKKVSFDHSFVTMQRESESLTE